MRVFITVIIIFFYSIIKNSYTRLGKGLTRIAGGIQPKPKFVLSWRIIIVIIIIVIKSTGRVFIIYVAVYVWSGADIIII